MGTGDERIDVHASAALRTSDGFFFGTLRWVDGDRLLIEVDAQIDPDTEAEARITLAPATGTALLRLTMRRVLVTARSEMPRLIFSIESVAPDDQARWKQWLHTVRTGGTFSDFSGVSSHTPFNQPMGQRTSAEVRKALETLSQKPSQDPPVLRSDISSTGGGARAAMREALRKAAAGTTSGVLTPTPSTRIPTPSVAPTPAAPPPPGTIKLGAPRMPPPPDPSAQQPYQPGDRHGAGRARPPAGRPPDPPRPPEARTTPPDPRRAMRDSPWPPVTPPPPRPAERTAPPPERPWGDAPPPQRTSPPPERSTTPDPRRPSPPPPPSTSHARESPWGDTPPRRETSVPPAPRPDARAPERPAPPPDPDAPTYTTSETRSAAWLDVRWPTEAGFATMLRTLLADRLLTVPTGRTALPTRDPLRLMLRVGTFCVECPGSVRGHSASGASYRVALDPAQIAELQAWLRGVAKR